MDKKQLAMLALLLVPLASIAAGDSDTLGQQTATAAFAQIQCKADYTVGILNAVIADVNSGANNSTLSQLATAIQSDITQVKSLETSGDAKSMREFIIGSFDSDIRSARQGVVDWRKGAGRVTKDERQKIKDDTAALKATFDSCSANARVQYTKARVTAYTTILDAYQKRADNLGAKGIDENGMSTIIANARAQIVVPLQAALSDANSGQAISQALRNYCLFDGCKNGTNFHLAAQFEIEKLTQILAVVSAKATAAGYTSDVTTAQSDLNAASKALASVGTAAYTPDTKKQVWDNIHGAAKAIQGIYKGLRQKKANTGNDNNSGMQGGESK